ncbi:MAG TPA: ABC transporter substrate-binding protein [Chloroflexota bacterium]|nr:ABC transporter substrate-binding protein [Chloroflexota bacterium]
MHRGLQKIGHLAALVGVAALVAGIPMPPAHADGLSQVTVTQMMNWDPEPEHGGQYAAEVLGYYKQAGLNEHIVPYNANANEAELISDNKITFGMMAADDLLAGRAAGYHLVAVLNTFQINPQCVMWHSGENIRSLADLSHHTVIRTPTNTWWKFLEKKYKYTYLTQIDNDFSFKAFYANPNAVLACFVTSEPYVAHQAGKQIKWALIADSGFDPYPQLMVTNDAMVRDHPDTVRAYVNASLRGWASFLANPAPTLSRLETYPDAKDYPLTPSAMLFSYIHLRSLVTGGEAQLHGIGTMSAQRFAELVPQLEGVGISLHGLDPRTTYTLAFVPH